MNRQVEVAIVGAGSAGLAALAQVRGAGRSFVLIDGGEPGTTCARVGCMPSKALLQAADDFHRRGAFARMGIDGGGQLAIDASQTLEYVRDMRDIFVDRVLAGSIDELGENFIAAPARFESLTRLRAGDACIDAGRVVIAVGSRPRVPPAWRELGERILTTDTVFEQPSLPASIAVIGLGVIGLELGQALARMGVAVTGFDRLDTVGGLRDAAVSQVARETLARELALHLGVAPQLSAQGDGLRVSAGDQVLEVERALVCIGRQSNADTLGLAELGVALDSRGIPLHDSQTLQVAETPLFIAGDVNAQRAILHEAVDEGRIAGYNAVQGSPVSFRRRVPLAITFTDPGLASVGAPADSLPPADTVVGEMRFGPVGRALLMGRNRGLLRIYARRSDGRLLGAEMCGPRCEHLAHLLAWALQQELGVAELLRMPYYHPAIEEALQAALWQAHAALDSPADELPGFARA